MKPVPKSEIRNPYPAARTKALAETGQLKHGVMGFFTRHLSADEGSGTSDLFRTSDFGFRIFT
jgi:hypothetical protein